MERFTIQAGATVYDADGEKLGKVIGFDGQTITVEEGWLFPSDTFVPVSSVARQDEDGIYLTVTKDQAMATEWTNVPAGDVPIPSNQAETGPYDLDRTDASFHTEPPPAEVDGF